MAKLTLKQWRGIKDEKGNRPKPVGRKKMPTPPIGDGKPFEGKGWKGKGSRDMLTTKAKRGK